MKFSLRKILAFAFRLVLPLALFLVLRAQASWRPQRVAGVTYHGLMAFSPDGTRFANASRDTHELVSLYDADTNKEIARHDFGDHISAMSFSPDGNTLAVAWSSDDGDNGMGGWNFAKETFEFKRAKDYVRHNYVCHQLRFSLNGKMLWLISNDDVRSYDYRRGACDVGYPKTARANGRFLQRFRTIAVSALVLLCAMKCSSMVAIPISVFGIS